MNRPDDAGDRQEEPPGIQRAHEATEGERYTYTHPTTGERELVRVVSQERDGPGVITHYVTEGPP